MTRLLQDGIRAARALSPDQQDMAGELLLALAGMVKPKIRLMLKQIADLKISLAQSDRGEFATGADMSAVWKKFDM